MHATKTSQYATYGAALVAVILSGCEALDTSQRAAKQTEYITVEFRRFVSGVYVNELADKYVQVDCRFSSTMSGTLPIGLSPERYMSFLALAPTDAGFAESPTPLTVVVPKDLADVGFSLKSGDNIRVKGQASEVTTTTLGGRVDRDLILKANLIERVD